MKLLLTKQRTTWRRKTSPLHEANWDWEEGTRHDDIEGAEENNFQVEDG